MAAEMEFATLRIAALRGGSARELSAFLSDFDDAYAALYGLEQELISYRHWRGMGPFGFFPPTRSAPFSAKNVMPKAQLVIAKIEIHSPGFWEAIGSLNPLQQIREYLKDRHERRKDRKYREQSEQEKLSLENELLREQLQQSQLTRIREQYDFLRAVGFDDASLKQWIWQQAGKPLSRLGRHQDSGLIAGPIENKDQPSEAR